MSKMRRTLSRYYTGRTSGLRPQASDLGPQILGRCGFGSAFGWDRESDVSLAIFVPNPRRVGYSLPRMTTLALSELLGATVYDPSGISSGRVREVTLAPQEDRSRISSLIVKTKSGNRVLPFTAVAAINGGVRASTAPGEW